MPDYEINDPYNCQVLITVPTMLEIILSKKTDFNNKIKYVILDEIQTLNDSELGHSLEKIIHFVQCPMIILSATIGNIDKFYEWLKSIHNDKGVAIYPKSILNTERFCDLKKFTYVPNLNNEIGEHLVPIHELFGYSYVDLKESRLSEEFFLLPNEIIELLNGLEIIATTERQKLLVNNVQPEKFFKSVVLNKNHVKRYQDFLINKLIDWCQKDEFGETQINQLFNKINEKSDKAFKILESSYLKSQKKWAIENISQLVKSLEERKMLPAIVFLNTSDFCNELAEKLVHDLEKEEEENKKETKKDIKQTTKTNKSIIKNTTKKRNDKDKDWREQSELLEEAQESFIDENKIDEKFTYFDRKSKLTNKEIDEEIDSHRHRPNIPKSMFEAWKRGIGVHHAVFHNKFRSSVEYLFRIKHLQIVFATETLSLGINMPCKTVVLTCDSIGFSSIKYKQMVGRAGRRTFDTIGNIVYYGLPQNKIKNFISSKIPNIKGNFSLDLNLISQLSVMNTYDSNSIKKFKSFVKNPIIKLNDDDYDYMTCKKIANLQINYLMSKSILDAKFNPSNQVLFSLPLRNEDVSQNIIGELIVKNYFDRFVIECNNDIEEIAKKIVNVLSHFIAVKYLLPTTSDTNILLPELPSLTKFLNSVAKYQSAYIRNFLNDKIEAVKASFPSFHNEINYPKNSYILDFYMKGKINDIKEINKVNETRLWYSLKSFRTVLRTINKSVTFPNISIRQAFRICEDSMDERFKLIIN
jgi:hypothetical protein